MDSARLVIVDDSRSVRDGERRKTDFLIVDDGTLIRNRDDMRNQICPGLRVTPRQ